MPIDFGQQLFQMGEAIRANRQQKELLNLRKQEFDWQKAQRDFENQRQTQQDQRQGFLDQARLETDPNFRPATADDRTAATFGGVTPDLNSGTGFSIKAPPRILNAPSFISGQAGRQYVVRPQEEIDQENYKRQSAAKLAQLATDKQARAEYGIMVPEAPGAPLLPAEFAQRAVTPIITQAGRSAHDEEVTRRMQGLADENAKVRKDLEELKQTGAGARNAAANETRLKAAGIRAAGGGARSGGSNGPGYDAKDLTSQERTAQTQLGKALKDLAAATEKAGGYAAKNDPSRKAGFDQDVAMQRKRVDDLQATIEQIKTQRQRKGQPMASPLGGGSPRGGAPVLNFGPRMAEGDSPNPVTEGEASMVDPQQAMLLLHSLLSGGQPIQ